MRNMVATPDDRDLSNKEKEHTHTIQLNHPADLVNSRGSQLGVLTPPRNAKRDFLGYKLFTQLKLKSMIPRPAERGSRRGHCPGARRHRGGRDSELSGLERNIHQLKLRSADAMTFFFISS